MRSWRILVYGKTRNKKSIKLERGGRRFEKIGEATRAGNDLHFNKDCEEEMAIEGRLQWKYRLPKR